MSLHCIHTNQFSSLRGVWLFATPWTAACQASLSITNSQSLLKLMSIKQVMPSSHLILRYPLLLLPSIFPSIRVFSNKSSLPIRWSNSGASASASALPMNIQDWFPLGLTGWISLQSKGLSRIFSNTTVQKHQFFSIQPSHIQLSHPYTTTRKTIALTIQSFVGKVISPLSRLVKLFFQRRSFFFFLNFMASVTICSDFGAQERKCFPICFHEVMVLDAINFIFWMLSFKTAFHSPLSLSSWDS